MVNSDGQLYTIEGIAGGLIMLFTAYLVLGSTSVYTPGDTHISDMQLEQLGTDALRMMNTPVNSASESTLQKIVENNNAAAAATAFDTTFMNYVNNKTGSEKDNLHYSAKVTYRNINEGDAVQDYTLAYNRNITGGEHPVRVTEWVMADKQLPGSGVKENRAVLVEVLLWRD